MNNDFGVKLTKMAKATISKSSSINGRGAARGTEGGQRLACPVSQGAGAARRMHSPRDMGKRNAEEHAAGACDLGDSLTTTGVFCLCSRSSSDAHFAGHLILDES